MKPAELFPGAVLRGTDGIVVASIVHDSGDVLDADREYYLFSELHPLPLSPAVLAGLGFSKDKRWWMVEGRLFVTYELEGYRFHDMCWIDNAHQLQALALHLHGVTLTWNQAAYEAAHSQTKT